MKTYDELTRLGRLRRLRQLAEVALDAYGLAGARLTFVHYEGNVIFRVDAPDSAPIAGQAQAANKEGPYVKNRYVLRVLTTSDTDYIASELTWLAVLSQDAGIPVREPVPTFDGRLLITVSAPGVPDGRIVTLMRWLDGRLLDKGMRPNRVRAWGRVVAQLHDFAAGWQPPEGFERPHWDWEGQLGGRSFSRPIEEIVAEIPDRFREPFEIVSAQAREVMEGLRKGPDAYGMIHGDMYPENVLFKGDNVYPFDFEDCGFGYWMWDIGVALGQWRWTEEWFWIRDAFLDGYAQIRSLPESQLAHLDLFMAAQYATMVLWSTVFIGNDPAMRVEYEEWRTKEGNKLLCYFERR